MYQIILFWYMLSPNTGRVGCFKITYDIDEMCEYCDLQQNRSSAKLGSTKNSVGYYLDR